MKVTQAYLGSAFMSVEEAYQYGKQAFAEGRPCVPFLHRVFIEQLNGPVGSGLPLLDAWHKGWTEANLADDSWKKEG